MRKKERRIEVGPVSESFAMVLCQNRACELRWLVQITRSHMEVEVETFQNLKWLCAFLL